MPTFRTFAFALTAMLDLSLAACSDTRISGDPPAQIAIMAPMTGPMTGFGGQLRYGVGQAIEDLNAHRLGADTRIMTLRAFDDQCDVNLAAGLAQRLASEKVSFVVGPFCSAVAVAAAPILTQANIVMVTPSASDPALTETGAGNIFRTVPRQDMQGAVLAKHILERYPGKPVALVDDGTTYGKLIAQSTRTALAASGVRLVAEESLGGADPSAVAQRLKTRNPGVILFGGFAKAAAALLVEARKQGIDAAFGGGDALVSSEFWREAGLAGEGAFLTFLRDHRASGAARRAIEGLTRFGIDAGGYTLYAYAAVEVVAEAAKRADSWGASALARTIHAGEFDTVVGRLSFDAKGDVKNPNLVIYVWHDGRYRPL